MFRVFSAVVTASVFVAVVSCPAINAQGPEAPVDFNRDIRPILSDKCFRCHGPDAKERQADLRFDVEASAKGDLGGHRAIVPGKPDASELVTRINTQDADERMPPADSGKQLSDREIKLLERWIAEGARWSQHWAYVAPRRHPIPPVKNAEWPSNWIDRFLLSRLEREELQPSADADRVTLVRRLFFDLTGLPPTPKDVGSFANSSDPNAYEQLVDRLLASDRYGERMAMYWLDLVRYADTVGYHGDQEHHISPYRDYVIDAFNDNLRFDQFTREQLAGDLLPPAPSAAEDDRRVERTIATGYNRLLQTSHEGGVQAKEYLAIYAADRVRNLSAVWLSATMGCCQCHNHKYDPYTAKDFYSMEAFFADIDEAKHLRRGADNSPTVREPELKVLTPREQRQIARLDEMIGRLQSELANLNSAAAGRSDELKAQIASATKQRDDLQNNARLTMITVAIEPRPIRILPRGDWLDDSGPLVGPAVPEFLGRLDVGDRRATRLDLANWLTDAEHGVGGLTARVMVNRCWYLLLGSGIAEVLDDFGGQGHPPSHPELLDNLAVEFVESGWNVKHLLKLIVMSRAYRQSSVATESVRQRDPGNRWYARQSSWRLPAEMVRDSALAVSGLLVESLGGRSVRPYQPDGYYQHLNFPKRTYQPDAGDSQYRRGVYTHWQRSYLHPMLKAFDAPSREECTAERSVSNTPQAALVLLNDPSFVEAARAFAVRVVRDGGSTTDDRLGWAWREVLCREPTTRERDAVRRLFEHDRDEYARDRTTADQLLKTGLSAAPHDFDVAELAGWTSVSRALLNLDETMTRY